MKGLYVITTLPTGPHKTKGVKASFSFEVSLTLTLEIREHLESEWVWCPRPHKYIEAELGSTCSWNTVRLHTNYELQLVVLSIPRI
jgi:hypothetical protein